MWVYSHRRCLYSGKQHKFLFKLKWREVVKKNKKLRPMRALQNIFSHVASAWQLGIRSSICLAVDARQRFSGHAASDKYFCQAPHLSSLQPPSICRHRWRPALTRMTEAPLHSHHLLLPFSKPLISTASLCRLLPPSRSFPLCSSLAPS